MGARRLGTAIGALAIGALGIAGLATPAGWSGAAPRTAVAQEAAARQGGARDPGPWADVPSGVPSPEPGDLARLRTRAESRDRPHDWLALGAALLAGGDWEGATGPLRRALEAEDPGVREDAAYDLALAHAVPGRPPGPGEDPGDRAPDRADEVRQQLLQARDGFRAVLRANPEAEDARWNLELVDRWLRREESGGGGGGGPTSGGGGEAEEARSAPMTEGEARRLLEAAAGAERDVQERRLERNRARDPASERNW